MHVNDWSLVQSQKGTLREALRTDLQIGFRHTRLEDMFPVSTPDPATHSEKRAPATSVKDSLHLNSMVGETLRAGISLLLASSSVAPCLRIKIPFPPLYCGSCPGSAAHILPRDF